MAFLKELHQNNNFILLKKYEGEDIKADDDVQLEELDKNSNKIRICVIDLETTGLSHDDDEIIEIAMKLIEVDKETGNYVTAVKKYESYNQPRKRITEEITALTGITNEDVKGKEIDWKLVERLFSYSQLVVAHNAWFDRNMLENYIRPRNIWACSSNDIDWRKRGFAKSSLELLSIWHGFYYDAHRAMNDVNATIHLMTHSHYDIKPIAELIENAKKPHYNIVNKFSYNEDYVRLLKKRSRAYRFNRDNKAWTILLDDEKKLEEEKEWLADNIYNGIFNGSIKFIDLYDKYKRMDK